MADERNDRKNRDDERELGHAISDADYAERQKLAARRDDLAGPSPSPLERLVVEQIALNWHMANCATATAARKELDAKRVEYHERRAARAHRRLMSSIRMLATIRRLAAPRLVAVMQQNLTVQSPPALDVTPPPA